MILHFHQLRASGLQSPANTPLQSEMPIQWTLDYPDPRLSGSRTGIIARAYNDLRMRVVAVDKKFIVYMAAKSVVLSTEDRQVVGQGCLPLSSTCSSPCSQQLALLALFTAAGSSRPVHSSWLFSPCSQQLVSAYGP